MEKLSEVRILEYKYYSEEEREQHVKWMKSQGFACSGQVQKTDDSLYEKNPKYYLYGKFSKRF